MSCSHGMAEKPFRTHACMYASHVISTRRSSRSTSSSYQGIVLDGEAAILYIFSDERQINGLMRVPLGAEQDHGPGHIVHQDCGGSVEYYCRTPNTSLGLVAIMVFFALLYFGLYCYFIGRAFVQLQARSATEFRMANMIVRLQASVPPLATSEFSLMICFIYVDYLFCSGNQFLYSWACKYSGRNQLAANF